MSASIGSGHTQAAIAVHDELIRISPDANITVVDFLDQQSALGSIIKETYLKMIDVFPNAYDFLYRWSQEPQSGTNVKNLTALIMKRRMLHLLNEHRPDLIVFTHPFPCCAAAYLRRTKRLSVPLAAVMTDFASHQLWIHSEIDTYFVANQEIKKALGDKGIAGDKIHITGIPISSKFARTEGINIAKKPSSSTVLIMGGGLGLGDVGRAVISLNSAKTQFEIIVVAGNNAKLRKKLLTLKTSSRHPMTVIGYTNRINELMGSASLLVTKPGALTCSEAIAMELPMLLLSPIPGQEEDNADYLTRQGVALRLPTPSAIPVIVDALVSQPEILADMKLNARILKKPDASHIIASILSANLQRTQKLPRQVNCL